jgi:hypothetical protein
MSRHEIPARNPDHKVIVGWDHPMMTFFVQVIDIHKEEAGKDAKFVLWKGTAPYELYEVDALAKVVARFADLTPAVRVMLYADKDEGR